MNYCDCPNCKTKDCPAGVEAVRIDDAYESAFDQLRADNARLMEECDKKTAWIEEIFRNLGLPCGDMGALENYILSNEKLTASLGEENNR